MPITANKRVGAFALCALGLVLGSTACNGGAPEISPPRSNAAPPTTGVPASGSVAPSATASAEAATIDPAALLWYEVRRITHVDGGERRSLMFGSLGGTLHGEVELGEQGPAAGDRSRAPWAWADPQAAGIFGGRALVWGRDEQSAIVEAVDLRDGSIELLIEAQDTVHVATAAGDFSAIFYITADSDTGLPTGLWVYDLESGAEPRQLEYSFARTPLSGQFRYRIAADADGARLAVQADENSVTVISLATNEAEELQPEGPIVGFADERLIALGRQSSDQARALVSFDMLTMEGQVILEGVSSAQVVPGSDEDLVAAMRINPSNELEIEILGVAPSGGEPLPPYTFLATESRPLLARQDRTYIGYQTAPGWVLLVESFSRFIVGGGHVGGALPPISHPTFLNLQTGDTLQVGPFVSE
jgi:hypothetical protein